MSSPAERLTTASCPLHVTIFLFARYFSKFLRMNDCYILGSSLIWTCQILNFEYFLIFYTAPACRKHQQIFDIQNATRPNGWSAEDITYSINPINMLMHNNKNAPAENNINPLWSFVLCILLTKSTVENHAVVFSDSDYYVSYIHDSSKLYSARQNCAVGNIYNRSQTLMKNMLKTLQAHRFFARFPSLCAKLPI